MKKVLDFRSDTVTKPTEEMRKAMYEAEIGDDVYGEDPTVNRLEEMAASSIGKEDSLFVPSGTFGNQLGVFTHCNMGDEIIISEKAHIIQYEVGAASIIAGVNTRTIPPVRSYITWEDIKPRIRTGENIHYPDTGLIVLENALANGDVQPLESMEEVRRGATELGVPIHLDGARIFNAALALSVDVKHIAAQADSVMFCLSKGLSAPIGSMLAGTKEYIKRARKNRKVMGGGMRQAGCIAAAGIVALTAMRDRLTEDHDHAKRIARAFLKHDDLFSVDIEKVTINMVFMHLNTDPDTHTPLEKLFEPYGIIVKPRGPGEYRFVTHYGIDSDDIDFFCSTLDDIAEKIRSQIR